MARIVLEQGNTQKNKNSHQRRSRLSRFPEDYRVLSEPDAAAYCGLSLVHFRPKRRDQKRPKYVRLTEKRIGYRFKDLLAWIEEPVF